jgi:hypothetical protein
MVAEIMPVARPCMIAVGMGDNGFVNRLPGIDIKISLPAV